MSKAPTYRDIGSRLQLLREAFSEMNKSDWAERHGFAQSQYLMWERGARRITVDEAQRLADQYGLTLDWIYRGRVDGLSENARNVLSSQ